MPAACWISSETASGAGCAEARANSTRAAPASDAGGSPDPSPPACKRWPQLTTVVAEEHVSKARTKPDARQLSSLRSNWRRLGGQHASCASTPGGLPLRKHCAAPNGQHPPALAALCAGPSWPRKLPGVGLRAAHTEAPWGNTAPRLRHEAQVPAAPAGVTLTAAAPRHRQHPGAAARRPHGIAARLLLPGTVLRPFLCRQRPTGACANKRTEGSESGGGAAAGGQAEPPSLLPSRLRNGVEHEITILS